MQLFAPLALLADGWQTDVCIDVDSRGRIAGLSPGNRAVGAEVERLPGPVIPGMYNLHSHAFQRAMAGLSERRGPAEDSFWTWRETMYEFVSSLQPDNLEAIAAQLYVEMLEGGYTGVAEFHYLHHDVDGQPYNRLAETSERIILAAKSAGIFLTHLPVLYMQGGFGGAPLAARQHRFANDTQRFLALMDSIQDAHGSSDEFRLGAALHSLRAVTPEAIQEVLAHLESRNAGAPVHIHIAEQTREVEECVAWCGARPIEWLLDNAPVDRRWCLVHATHTSDAELDRLVASGAVVGLCPTTEANLGDGIFPAEAFVRAGGRFGIGSDSHVCVDPAEELRLLEYGQRLTAKRRAVLAGADSPSVGRSLYTGAASGGARAMGVAGGALKTGARADLVVLEGESPALYGRRGDALLDAMIFGSSRPVIDQVWVGGRRLVSQGIHAGRDNIYDRYRATVSALQLNHS